MQGLAKFGGSMGAAPSAWERALPRIAGAALMSALFSGLSGTAQDKVSVPPPRTRDAGIEQRLNNQVPLDLKFRDESGKPVSLGSFFGKRPVILSLVYYGCPMLCTLTEHGLVDSLREVQSNIGEQFEVVTVSFDPRENPKMATRQKDIYVGLYGRPSARRGWHFLVGDESSIQALAGAVGFRYRYIPEIDQFTHPSAIVMLTPNGRVSRYFLGIQYPPQDIRRALADASSGRIADPAEMSTMMQNAQSAGVDSGSKSVKASMPPQGPRLQNLDRATSEAKQ